MGVAPSNFSGGVKYSDDSERGKLATAKERFCEVFGGGGDNLCEPLHHCELIF